MKKLEIKVPGGILSNGCLFEQIQAEGVSKFAIKGSELGIRIQTHIEDDDKMFLPLDTCPWSLPGEPLDYGAEKQLWKEVRQFIYDHVDYPDDRFYDIATAWVLATYRIEEWEAVPYLIFHGPIDSGKTRALETLASISFRGWLATSITEATLFRIVEKFKPTIFIDQTEMLTHESKQAVMNLLNSGYRRGQIVPRIREQDREIEFFKCFGFKALAGTRELSEAIRSRAFIFKMSKTTRPLKLFIDKRKALELRSKLLMYRFINVKLTEDEFIETQSLTGRITEKALPLKTVMPFNEDAKNPIISFVNDQAKDQLEEQRAGEEAIVLSAIIDAYAYSGREGKVAIAEIAPHVNRDLPEREKFTHQKIGYISSRIGFKKTRIHTGATAIVYDAGLIDRLKRRYLVDDIEPLVSQSRLQSTRLKCYKPRHHDVTEPLTISIWHPILKIWKEIH